MNILIYTSNQLTQLKTSIKTILYLKNYTDIELFVVDNYSQDGTLEWLQSQAELNYIAFDEGIEKQSVVLNKALEIFDLKENVFIVRPNFIVMPDTVVGLEKFVEHLDLERAVVGVYCNTFGYTQKINISGYQSELTINDSMSFDYKVELGVDPNVFYLYGDVFDTVGGFDEAFDKEWECLEDFFLRAIKIDVPLIVPKAPIAVFDVDLNRPTVSYDYGAGRDILKEKWNMNYFNIQPNRHIVETVSKMDIQKMNILEIGCDNAATLIEIKNLFPSAEIYGVEINETAAEIAAHFANVYTGNIEEHFPFEDIKFDLIIFGDVLEHLSNPERILTICKDHLDESGKIIASIPNLMHISVISELLKGNFEYKEMGLLDKSHIHFFTYNEIVKMFQNVGFTQMKMVTINSEKESDRNDEIIDTLLKLEPSAERFMYTTYQYIVIAGV